MLGGCGKSRSRSSASGASISTNVRTALDGKSGRGGGLVGQHQPRAVGQSPGDGYPLFLAAGKFFRLVVDPLSQPHPGEHVGGAAVDSVLGAEQFQAHVDVLQSGERGKQIVVLKDEADLAAERRFAARPMRRTVRGPAPRRFLPGPCASVPISVSSVVLPEPEGPVMMTISPGITSRLLSNSDLFAQLSFAKVVVQTADARRRSGRLLAALAGVSAESGRRPGR